jgi:antitoxin HicB
MTMSNEPVNKHMGSSFDDFLAEDGLLTDVEAVALKRVIAFQLEQEMKRSGLTKTELASRMETSRSAVDRLLDPENHAVTLRTLERAAGVLGKRLRLELV